MSSYKDRVDPELLPGFSPEIEAWFGMIGPDMEPVRKMGEEMLKMNQQNLPPFPGSEEVVTIPGLNGAPDVPVRCYRPETPKYPDAAMVWLHGGGYIMGAAEDPSVYRFTPLMHVFSVDYRMAPEHRSPAAAEDSCAAIEWVAANAAELGIDPRKIILGGPSGGGGLAASAALLNRDRGGPALLYQFLIYPMLDDTHDTPSGHMDIPAWTWNREISLRAWDMYVEEDGATPYAAAARATDLSGLPPTYIMTGDLDLFRDEDIDYAKRLSAAGIPVDLAVFPGAPHGFDLFAPDAAVSKRANAHMIEALEQTLSKT
ncbi:MAG: alpha/beta hydrolase [Alphaproteobacteria bacterium]